MCYPSQDAPRHITACPCGSTLFSRAGIQWFPAPTTHFVRDVQYKRCGEIGWGLWTCLGCGTTKLDMDRTRSVLRVKEAQQR